MEAPLINNTEWLRGYRAFQQGHGCPWGNESARQGWIAAKQEGTELCSHPADERTTRTGHGYLGDYGPDETHELCTGCGWDFDHDS